MWTPSNLPGSAAYGDSQAHSGRFWGSCLPMPTPLPSLGEAVGAPQNLYMVSLGEVSRKQTPALPLNLPIIESSLPELRCPSTPGIPFSYFFSLMTPAPAPQALLGTQALQKSGLSVDLELQPTLLLSQDSTRVYTGFIPHPGPRSRPAGLKAGLCG